MTLPIMYCAHDKNFFGKLIHKKSIYMYNIFFSCNNTSRVMVLASSGALTTAILDTAVP